MSGKKVRCVIGVSCLLLAGCVSMPVVSTSSVPARPMITSPAPTDTRNPAQAPTLTLAPTPTPAPPAFQFQCGSDIQEIAYSPDGTLLAALGKQSIFICDMSTLSLRLTLETESEIAGGIDWSPKGTRLVAGLATGQVRIWDTATWQEVITYQASDTKAESWDVAWSPDGYRLLTTGVEVGTHIWHASTGEELLSTERSYTAAWSPDSKQIVISDAYGRTFVKDAATGQALLYINIYCSSLESAAWSPDGTRFVAGFDMGTMTMFDAETAEALLSWEAHDVAGSSAFLDYPVWSADGKLLAAVSSYDGTNSIIYIWDTSTGQELAAIGPVDEAVSLDWSPDGKYLAAGIKNGTVSLWEPSKLVRSPESTVKTFLTAEGPWYIFMASVMWDGPPYLWAINADGTGLTKLSHEPILRNFAVRPTITGEKGITIAFAVDSPRVSEDDMLKMVTLPGGEVKASIPLGATQTGSNVYHLRNLRAAITAGGLDWSPDGSKLAFAGARNGDSSDISIYDTDTGAVTRITTEKGYAYPLRWSPDGRYLIYQRFTDVWMGQLGGEGGVWSARTDGTGEVSMTRGASGTFLGWRGSTEGIFERWDEQLGFWGIEATNVETGESQTIVGERYGHAVFAEEYNALLIMPDDPDAEAPLVLIRDGRRIEIPGRKSNWIRWDNALDLFVGWAGDETFYISPTGQYVDPPQATQPAAFQSGYLTKEDVNVFISPDKTLWARRYYLDGKVEVQLWIGKPEAEPTTKIFSFGSSNYIADITWSPDSQSLFLLGGDGLWIARRPDFKFAQIGKGMVQAELLGDYEYISAWVP